MCLAVFDCVGLTAGVVRGEILRRVCKFFGVCITVGRCWVLTSEFEFAGSFAFLGFDAGEVSPYSVFAGSGGIATRCREV